MHESVSTTSPLQAAKSTNDWSDDDENEHNAAFRAKQQQVEQAKLQSTAMQEERIEMERRRIEEEEIQRRKREDENMYQKEEAEARRQEQLQLNEKE